MIAKQWAYCCRKVQERFAWLDEKNARDIEGHLPKHPVSFQWPCRNTRQLVDVNTSCFISPGQAWSPCNIVGIDRDDFKKACINWSHSRQVYTQDYDPRTVKVPPEVLGKMSGMCSSFWLHMCPGCGEPLCSKCLGQPLTTCVVVSLQWRCMQSLRSSTGRSRANTGTLSSSSRSANSMSFMRWALMTSTLMCVKAPWHGSEHVPGQVVHHSCLLNCFLDLQEDVGARPLSCCVADSFMRPAG